jgi:hypothetical protein
VAALPPQQNSRRNGVEIFTLRDVFSAAKPSEIIASE